LISAGARIAPHGRDGFVKCCENPLLAEDRRDVVSFHVGSKIGTDPGEDDVDPATRQFVEQIAYRLRGGVVDIRDCAGVNDEPANRRRRGIHQGTHLVGEAVTLAKNKSELKR
jgi:hypothetical protein